MTIALRTPEKVSDIIAVDNAPVDGILSSGFSGYVRGMKKIEAAKVTRLSDADKILQEVEPVELLRFVKQHGPTANAHHSHYQFANFCWVTCTSPRERWRRSSVFLLIFWEQHLDTWVTFPLRTQMKFDSRSLHFSSEVLRVNMLPMKRCQQSVASFRVSGLSTLMLAIG